MPHKALANSTVSLGQRLFFVNTKWPGLSTYAPLHPIKTSAIVETWEWWFCAAEANTKKLSSDYTPFIKRRSGCHISVPTLQISILLVGLGCYIPIYIYSLPREAPVGHLYVNLILLCLHYVIVGLHTFDDQDK